MTPKTILQEKVERATRMCAKDLKLPIDDPIMKDFRRGVSMAFGKRLAINRKKAEAAERQPLLWDGKR